VITKIAIPGVKAGESKAFEAAMQEAKQIIATAPDFMGLSVSPCIEHTHQYLLQVQWRTLADHTDGFRNSANMAAGRYFSTISMIQRPLCNTMQRLS